MGAPGGGRVSSRTRLRAVRTATTIEMSTSRGPIPPVTISCRFVDQATLLACAVIVLADWLPAIENPAVTAPTACCQASGDTAGRCRGGGLITLFSKAGSAALACGFTSPV